jgi:hypothetical protein
MEHQMEKIITAVFGVVGLIIVLSLLFAIPTYLLWNWLMPELFNIKEITLVQAWGLMVLSGILFKNSSSTK